MTDALFPDEAFVEILQRDQPYSPTGAATGSNINVTTDIDNFEESGFEREVETRPFFHKAKVSIKKPQADGELKVNAKITRALWDQMLWGGTNGSDFTSGGAQNPYRVTFTVTKDTTATIASGSIMQGTGSDTYRKVYANCYVTAFNPKLEAEGLLEGEVTFMVAPLDENASANVRIQQGTTGFAALGSYTSSQKWT